MKKWIGVLVAVVLVVWAFGPGCREKDDNSSRSFPPLYFDEYPDNYVYEAAPGVVETLALDEEIFYVRFVEGVTLEEVQSLLDQYGLTISSRFESNLFCPGFCLIDVPTGRDPRDYFVDFRTRDPGRFGEESMVELATPVYYNPEFYSPDKPPTHESILKTDIAIMMNRIMSPEEELEFLSRYDLYQDPLDKPGDQFLYAHVMDPKAWSVFDAVELLKNVEEVVHVAPLWWLLGLLNQSPSDEPLFGDQWYLDDPTLAHIDIPGAWGISQGDTGFDYIY